MPFEKTDWKVTTVGAAKLAGYTHVWWRPDNNFNVNDPDSDLAYFVED